MFKTNDGLLKQFMKDIHHEIHKKCEVQGKPEGEHPGCCNYCTETFKQLEEEINSLSWELTDHKADAAYLQTYSDGVGK